MSEYIMQFKSGRAIRIPENTWKQIREAIGEGRARPWQLIILTDEKGDRYMDINIYHIEFVCKLEDLYTYEKSDNLL